MTQEINEKELNEYISNKKDLLEQMTIVNVNDLKRQVQNIGGDISKIKYNDVYKIVVHYDFLYETGKLTYEEYYNEVNNELRTYSFE